MFFKKYTKSTRNMCCMDGNSTMSYYLYICMQNLYDVVYVDLIQKRIQKVYLAEEALQSISNRLGTQVGYTSLHFTEDDEGDILAVT